jgi:hypothetical protein
MAIWPQLTKMSFPRLAKKAKSIAHQGASGIGEGQNPNPSLALARPISGD